MLPNVDDRRIKNIMFKNVRSKKLRFLLKMLVFAFVCTLLCIAVIYVVDNHVSKVGSDYIVSGDNVPEADAIIVLGAYVFPEGQPSAMLKDRLDTGIKLYNKDRAPKLILTGDHGQKGYDEVNGMREYVQSRGIVRDDIFMDHAGFCTYDSIYRARDVFMVKKAIVVTQKYHLKRALYIARKLGIEAYGVSADKRRYAGQDYYNAREVAARFKDYVQVNILRSKPRFLEEAIPVWEDGSMTDDGKT